MASPPKSNLMTHSATFPGTRCSGVLRHGASIRRSKSSPRPSADGIVLRQKSESVAAGCTTGSPLTSRIGLTQAMPIAGVSRITVVLGNETGCRVTVVARRCPTQNAAGGKPRSKRAGTCGAKHSACLRQTIPASSQQKGFAPRSPKSSSSSQNHVRPFFHLCPPYKDEKHIKRTLRNTSFHVLFLRRAPGWSIAAS
jgi:hypothetical protein